MIKLSSCCEIFSGFALKEFNESKNGLPIIKIGNILTDGTIQTQNCQYSCEKVKEKYISKYNDIYIALSGATGKVGMMKSHENFIINQRVGIVRCKNNKIPIDYLKHYLISKTNKILSDATGCAQPNISPKMLENYEIKDISFEEMESISKKLNTLNDIIGKQKEELAKLDQLVKSQFIEMFGDSCLGWKFQTINLGVLGKFNSGGTPDRKKQNEYNGTIPWITTISLGQNFIDKSNAVNYINNKAITESSTRLIPENSLIIGTRVGVGKTSVNLDAICTNQDIISLYNIENSYIPIYLKFVVDSYQYLFDQNKKGATIKGVTSDFVKNLKVPEAPIDLQNKFADFVKHIDKLKFRKTITKLKNICYNIFSYKNFYMQREVKNG